ncbi:sensor histidine kinase [Spirosoma rhododendri]|uniref:histidine kinase n=1 Tax=Spirosoma rhododendri TaxID=2728024 RepID=A0A7L5DLE9_9BACT|nr:HAMP domain-containing sensor histidine kinase [Spirosoma rhododendri]QJD79299.1 HAMP domain-containing histidine kinase [Spirosoma rhododendri]
MPHRSTLQLLLVIALCLAILTVGLLYGNWPGLDQFSLTSQPAIRWLVMVVLALFSQTLFGYAFWQLMTQKQQSTVKTESLNAIVHEFQTPITAIRMAIDILDSPIARDQPERAEKYFRIIREENERLQKQVEMILTLARADNNTLALNQEPISLNDLLNSIAERHGDYLQLNLGPNNHHLMADRMHLTNILHNLLDNAVKYSADTPEVTIQTNSSIDGFVISVRDRGVGISPTVIPHIFQPFYRVQDHNSPSVKGFGLGLSYVQRIVQAHKWDIWVKSEVGKGSEFTIQIPPDSLINPHMNSVARQMA